MNSKNKQFVTLIYMLLAFIALAGKAYTPNSCLQPKTIFKAVHKRHNFTMSNEAFRFYFVDYLKELAKKKEKKKKYGYIGVASNQNFDLIGGLKPDYAWLYDTDINVVRIMKIYRAAFLVSPTPKQWSAFFESDNIDQGKDVLNNLYADDKDRDGIIDFYLDFVGKMKDGRSSRALFTAYVKKGFRRPYTFLENIDSYKHNRWLFENNRVTILQANHGSEYSLKAVGDEAKALNVEIAAYYLSNAIEGNYLGDITIFEENMAALPVNENTVILSTGTRAKMREMKGLHRGLGMDVPISVRVEGMEIDHKYPWVYYATNFNQYLQYLQSDSQGNRMELLFQSA